MPHPRAKRLFLGFKTYLYWAKALFSIRSLPNKAADMTNPKTMKHIFILSALLLSLLSCKDNVSTMKSLEDIESYIQQCPEDALEAIRSMDTISNPE